MFSSPDECGRPSAAMVNRVSILTGSSTDYTISGTVEFTGISGVPSGEQDLNSATRIGLGAGLGAVFSLGGIKLDANIQYHLINMGGKEYKIETITSHTRLDQYTNLNDAEDPSAGTLSDHFITDSRNMSAIEFKLSLMFGL